MAETATSRAALANANRVTQAPAEDTAAAYEALHRRLSAIALDAERLQKDIDCIGAQIQMWKKTNDAVQASLRKEQLALQSRRPSDPISLDSLLRQIGYEPLGSRVYQWQYMIFPPDFTKKSSVALPAAAPPPVPSPIPGILWRCSFQIAGRVEVQRPGDWALSFRFDHKTTSLRQIDLELKYNLLSWHGGFITLLYVRPKITVDRAPSQLSKPGVYTHLELVPDLLPTRVAAGLEATFRIRGAAADFKALAGFALDVSKFWDPKARWTDALVFKFEFTVPLSLDSYPPFSWIKVQFPDTKWSWQLKCFLEFSATPDKWAQIFVGLTEMVAAVKTAAVTGVAAAVQTARAAAAAAEELALATGRRAAEGARALAANPAARHLAGLGLLATAAAYGTSAIGALAIGRALRSGRDESILRNYCEGYAEELELAMGMPVESLTSRIYSFGDLDFGVLLNEISAHVHQPVEVYFWRSQRGPTVQDVNYANALGAARKLGRAGALVGMGQLLLQHPPETWTEIQRRERERLLTLRERGYQSLRQRYLDVLNRQLGTNINDIGLPLLNLPSAA